MFGTYIVIEALKCGIHFPVMNDQGIDARFQNGKKFGFKNPRNEKNRTGHLQLTQLRIC